MQKCVRTPDIEDVGKTTRHGTFFEMCGNFSFGDYFKEGAIELAWDLVTKSQADGGWGLEESRLWPSVYVDDPEAVALWRKVTGLPDERIVRLGKKENYWSMGVPGPGGPCSEILYDRGPDYGPDGEFTTTSRLEMPTELEDRYLEIWNLVFMQDELSAVRSKDDFDIAGSLPKKNIDTGMGLERVAFLLQGKDNMYEIDVMFPVIEKAEELTGRDATAPDHEDDVRFRVVADHVRSSMMLIGDGVTPGNEAPRLRAAPAAAPRRTLDAAARRTRTASLPGAAAGQPRQDGRDVHRAGSGLGAHLERRVRRGGRVPPDAAHRHDDLRRRGAARRRRAARRSCRASKAFALHDTYGFPIDLTLEMASEQGLSVDEEGFRRLMTEQRDRAKADAQRQEGPALRRARLPRGRRRASAARSSSPATPRSSPRRRCAASSTARGVATSAREGDEVELVLDRTPFYAEGGGQLADQGVIELGNGARLQVLDVQSPITRPGRAPGQGARRRGHGRPAGPGARRHRAAQVDQPRAHRDAHGAQGVPRGARRHRDPGRLGERAGPVPVRLLRDRARCPRPRWPTSRPGSTTWCSPTSACTRRS